MRIFQCLLLKSLLKRNGWKNFSLHRRPPPSMNIEILPIKKVVPSKSDPFNHKKEDKSMSQYPLNKSLCKLIKIYCSYPIGFRNFVGLKWMVKNRWRIFEEDTPHYRSLHLLIPQTTLSNEFFGYCNLQKVPIEYYSQIVF